MKKQTGNLFKRFMATALTVLLLTSGTSTILAAADEGDTYQVSETGDMADEYVRAADPEKFASMIEVPAPGSGLSLFGTLKTFNWVVTSGQIKRTGGFKCSSGDTISVTYTVTPSSTTVEIGIIDPDGVWRYFNGKNTSYHIFSITKTGTYYIYVDNTASIDITIDAAYAY